MIRPVNTLGYIGVITLFGLFAGCGGKAITLPDYVDATVLEQTPRGEIVEIKTRRDVTVKVLYQHNPTPQGAVILFPGHQGYIELDSDGNVTKRYRKSIAVTLQKELAEKGYDTALVEAPSDHRDSAGMLFGFRLSRDHIEDMKYVLAYVRQRAPGAPVWLVGHDQGATSAAQVAAKLEPFIKGGVYLSPFNQYNDAGNSFIQADLIDIDTPALFIMHDRSECKFAETWAINSMAKELGTKRNRRKQVVLEGGSLADDGKPCSHKSPHGLWAVSDEVERQIIDFMEAYRFQ